MKIETYKTHYPGETHVIRYYLVELTESLKKHFGTRWIILRSRKYTYNNNREFLFYAYTQFIPIQDCGTTQADLIRWLYALEKESSQISIGKTKLLNAKSRPGL